MIEEKTRTEKATAPPKRWRNRWRLSVRVRHAASGQEWEAGDQWGTSIWPSREIAEQRAQEKLAGTLRFNGVRKPTAHYIEWLGAFPCD